MSHLAPSAWPAPAPNAVGEIRALSDCFEKQVWSVNPPDRGSGSTAERLMAARAAEALDLGSDLPPAFMRSISTRDLTPLPIVNLRACCAQTLSSITATP